MKTTLLLCALLYSGFLAPLRLSADEQPGGGAAAISRHLRLDAQVSTSRIQLRQKSAEATVLPLGIRRLVPQQYATIQAAISASTNGAPSLLQWYLICELDLFKLNF